MLALAIYRKTEQGTQRIGTFTYKGKGLRSMRRISAAFFERHPSIAPEQRNQYYAMQRCKINGQVVDCGEMLPMEVE